MQNVVVLGVVAPLDELEKLSQNAFWAVILIKLFTLLLFLRQNLFECSFPEYISAKSNIHGLSYLQHH